jgi:16S rRNA (adenine1518-N6/adenine1519-N6)-dimethyltransferase
MPDRERLDAALAEAGVDSSLRGEMLGIEQFAAIAVVGH